LFQGGSRDEKAVNISYRFAKSFLLDLPVDYFVCVLQHEVFGHGARLREYGVHNIIYRLNVPLPYGGGGGSTSWNYISPVSPGEDIAVAIGGVEANSILSGQIVNNCIRRGTMSSREALLYTLASNNITQYLWKTQHETIHVEGNDMVAYEDGLNAKEGFSDNHKLTVDDLSRQNILLKLLDPFQYIALYTFFKTYLMDGSGEFEIPMIHLGEVKLLPAFRFGLSPYGSELYFVTYAEHLCKFLEISIRYGFPLFHKSWGFGCSAVNLFQTETVTIGGGIDLWNQPLLEGLLNSFAGSGTGGAFSVHTNVKIFDASPSIHLTAEFKTKTAGYLQGEPLGPESLVRAGLQLVTQ
jgi:hypothetical protein